MPTGVRMPVVSMSMRFLIGMVQAFEVPGIFSASFISSTSSFGRNVIGREAPEDAARPLGRPRNHQVSPSPPFADSASA